MPRDTYVPSLSRHVCVLTRYPHRELHKSAYKGAITELDVILLEGGDVNQLGAQNRTPLHRAVGGKSPDTTSYLIEKGAKVNFEDDAGRTPLHWAAIVGSADCAKVLVQAGADINALTRSGKTPLHMGAEAGMVEFVKSMMKLDGIQPALRDSKNQTAYELAKKGAHKEVMDLVKTKENATCCVVM